MRLIVNVFVVLGQDQVHETFAWCYPLWPRIERSLSHGLKWSRVHRPACELVIQNGAGDLCHVEGAVVPAGDQSESPR